MITREDAEQDGYTVDSHCYPWAAYKGDRFAPKTIRHCMTDLEAELTGALRMHIAILRGRVPADFQTLEIWTAEVLTRYRPGTRLHVESRAVSELLSLLSKIEKMP